MSKQDDVMVGDVSAHNDVLHNCTTLKEYLDLKQPQKDSLLSKLNCTNMTGKYFFINIFLIKITK